MSRNSLLLILLILQFFHFTLSASQYSIVPTPDYLSIAKASPLESTLRESSYSVSGLKLGCTATLLNISTCKFGNIDQQGSVLVLSQFQSDFQRTILAQSSMDTLNPKNLQYRIRKSGKQILAAELFGSIGILAGLGANLVYSNYAELNLGVALRTVYVGYLTGVGIGIHLAGNDQYESCPWWIPTLTSLLSGNIALKVYSKGPKNGIADTAPIIIPTFCSLISFNIFAK